MADTAATDYVDGKKWFWPLATILGFLPVASMWVYLQTGSEAWLWSSPLFFYVLVPIIETFFGEDENNPPREAIPALRDDPFYRWAAFSALPVSYLNWIVGAWFIATQDLSLNGYIAILVANGLMGAGALNTAHEVGHRRDKMSLFVARYLLCLCGMGHFRIEHNLGHHVQVATPEDSATAMMGETFYAFVLHELPGGYKRAWGIEKKRLAKKGKSAFSLENEVLQNTLITIFFYTALTAYFGWAILPYLLGGALLSNLMLSSANYVEHYGLMRAKRDDGRYERVQPHHSWNANHIVSNIMMFHLQRHSDHHAHAERPYQCLRHFDTSPQLPAGYFTMFMAAWNPPIWFKIMDPLVAEQMEGDMTKAYIKPSKREKIFAKYHKPESSLQAAE
ncbi:alkane 1-monooxygenase [Kordiimonas sp. SCSIO 12603]|uniref:alkane 1-monooxygenase n=1 Tax=Kordiimonas sp. SCSIO 12603 TaxID=2829596 RepID=UPI0021039C2E|nr:alkane 1-monooxygenase [Kordiimonas sp. SCSIO 12603]UTW58075.1 alkane 1-monooxygenase [Kordiimonas sp. SCSIO 12603]